MTLLPKNFAPKPPPPGSAAGSKAYLYDDELVRAIKVAMVIDRPLLLRGAPGCGKTTLAADIARQFGRVFLQQVVTSRTEARDLEWTFDAVRRLSDAQLTSKESEARVADTAGYVQPQALWWAFNPETARTRGGSKLAPPPKPPAGLRDPRTDARDAVALIDEIDKAEPELANDLLEPFDRGGFTVAETGHRVKRTRKNIFLVVTTNDARDLPGAFLRRCVVFEVTRPRRDQLVEIAKAHHGEDIETRVAMPKILDALERLARQAELRDLRQPGTAEFLDAVSAALSLRDPKDLDEVMNLTMWKHPRKELRAT